MGQCVDLCRSVKRMYRPTMCVGPVAVVSIVVTRPVHLVSEVELVHLGLDSTGARGVLTWVIAKPTGHR